MTSCISTTITTSTSNFKKATAILGVHTKPLAGTPFVVSTCEISHDVKTVAKIVRQTHLPRDPAKDEQQPVVDIEPVVGRIYGADPVHVHGAERLHVLVCPSEGDAHPQAYEDAEQLDDVSIRHGVEPAEQSVEYGDASAEDH